jgi:hypothetical protein
MTTCPIHSRTTQPLKRSAISKLAHKLTFSTLLVLSSLIGLVPQAHAANKRLQPITQVGVTQATYSEPDRGASSTQIGLHIKQSFNYTLIQNRIDLFLGAYINGLGELIEATQIRETGQPETTGGPTYWGVSLRAPISVVKKTSRWDIRIAPGYSAWGMIVEDQAYGLKLLAAPTLSLAFRNRKPGTRPWGLSFKFSPLDMSVEALTQNRELAAGFDFQISKANAKRPLLLTLDYAITNYDLPSGTATQNREGEFRSLSAGLALRW